MIKIVYILVIQFVICFYLGVAHSFDITFLASDSKYLFTAAANEIFAWKYGHKWVCYIRLITHFFIFGSFFRKLNAINMNDNLKLIIYWFSVHS